MSDSSAATAAARPANRSWWTLVVPVKRLELAKSRLAELAGEHRPRLALAFAADTVAVAAALEQVRVIVVTDDQHAAEVLGGLGADVVRDLPDAGLNPALRYGARSASAGHGVGALSADLPALRGRDLIHALDTAQSGPVVVPDAAGTGSTLYLAPPGHAFTPAFGSRSLAAHVAEGARVLDGGSVWSIRRDVDTPADLAAALNMGVGAYTARAYASLPKSVRAALRP
ncbi:MAG: 2-phospho-L-lactate guanylyltransferase [Sporichthyaceae bacterium]